MKYELMEIPFESVDFRGFTKKQAEEFFQWYMEEKNKRIAMLEAYIAKYNKDIALDYTPESLLPLWKWYEEQICFVERTNDEIEEEKSRTPEWLHPDIPNTKMSVETMQLCLDVSMYFAEVIIKNSNGKAYWGYFTKPKREVSVNRPVVLGFEGGEFLDSRMVIYNCTMKECAEKRGGKIIRNVL